jgi:hypothetical protein
VFPADCLSKFAGKSAGNMQISSSELYIEEFRISPTNYISLNIFSFKHINEYIVQIKLKTP